MLRNTTIGKITLKSGFDGLHKATTKLKSMLGAVEKCAEENTLDLLKVRVVYQYLLNLIMIYQPAFQHNLEEQYNNELVLLEELIMVMEAELK